MPQGRCVQRINRRGGWEQIRVIVAWLIIRVILACLICNYRPCLPPVNNLPKWYQNCPAQPAGMVIMAALTAVWAGLFWLWPLPVSRPCLCLSKLDFEQCHEKSWSPLSVILSVLITDPDQETRPGPGRWTELPVSEGWQQGSERRMRIIMRNWRLRGHCQQSGKHKKGGSHFSFPKPHLTF